jgi:hypothetical protein
MEGGMTQVSTFDSPIFYDKAAQEINVAVTALGYIDDVYGVAFPGVEAEESYPEIYVNDGSKINLRLLPDTNRAMSFFTVTGDMIEIDEDYYSIPMAVYVWFNLLKLDDTKEYDYTAEVIKDFTHVLDKYGAYDLAVDVVSPFDPFSMLDKDKTNNIMRPYTAFRINFNKNMQICS